MRRCGGGETFCTEQPVQRTKDLLGKREQIVEVMKMRRTTEPVVDIPGQQIPEISPQLCESYHGEPCNIARVPELQEAVVEVIRGVARVTEDERTC